MEEKMEDENFIGYDELIPLKNKKYFDVSGLNLHINPFKLTGHLAPSCYCDNCKCSFT